MIKYSYFNICILKDKDKKIAHYCDLKNMRFFVTSEDEIVNFIHRQFYPYTGGDDMRDILMFLYGKRVYNETFK